jgi:A/G-specific adenine glycosylase
MTESPAEKPLREAEVQLREGALAPSPPGRGRGVRASDKNGSPRDKAPPQVPKRPARQVTLTPSLSQRERGQPVASRPDAGRLAGVHAALLGWYERSGRDLPWRRTRDPYAILVSEIMLQQTQVDRVLPKWRELLQAFPTFSALAAAPLADVIRRWAPLGYNRRAVHLHGIARAVSERPDGCLPDRVEELRALNGLGSYTANAVACFAFERPVAVVDTNVRRVLGRLFADLIGLDPPAGRTLEQFAASVLPPEQAYDWNQALMDLGATICTARAPACGVCPMALVCTGRPLLAERGKLPRAAERKNGYTVRPAFEQTARYYRGRIVACLRELAPAESVSPAELGQAIRPDFGPEHATWIADLIEGLRRDGLAATSEGPDGIRVTLP